MVLMNHAYKVLSLETKKPCHINRDAYKLWDSNGIVKRHCHHGEVDESLVSQPDFWQQSEELNFSWF